MRATDARDCIYRVMDALDVAWAARKLRRMRRRGNPVYPHSGGAT